MKYMLRRMIMSRKKATHCTKCGDDFTCGEEYISFDSHNMCWDCYASFHEKELAKEYATTKIVTSTYVCYILHNYLFGKPIRHSYGKDVITWAKIMYPIQLKKLQEAHIVWQTGCELDKVAPMLVGFAQKIAREMNDGNPIRAN